MGVYMQYDYTAYYIITNGDMQCGTAYCIIQEYAASVVLHRAQGYSVWYYMLYYHWGIQCGYVIVYCIIIGGGLYGMA